MKKKSTKKTSLYRGHDESIQGDSSFIDLLLPDNIYAYHIDTYDVEGRKKFQGSFFRTYPEHGLETVVNDPPLEVLKAAQNYSIIICTTCGDPHLVWTLWFL